MSEPGTHALPCNLAICLHGILKLMGETAAVSDGGLHSDLVCLREHQ